MVIMWKKVPCLFIVISLTLVITSIYALENDNEIKSSSSDVIINNSTLSSANITSGDVNITTTTTTELPTIATTKSGELL